MRKLLEGHATFRREFVAGSREFLARLASSHQSPHALYIGCADSRVVPELLTSSAPGELFVVRNVANLVPPAERADTSVGAAMEYAVLALHVEHVVVCGHLGCGGVKAMFHGVEPSMPELEAWLAEAAAANAVARALPFDAESWRRAVEENVVDQLANLTTFPFLRERLERGAVHLHGWLYDLHGSLSVYDDETGSFLAAR